MDPNEQTEVDEVFSAGDLTTLVDLQKFLAEEIGKGPDQTAEFTRAFMPLTDGLGLHPSATARAAAPKASPVAPQARPVPKLPQAAPGPVSNLEQALGAPLDPVAPVKKPPGKLPASRLIVDESVQDAPPARNRSPQWVADGFAVSAVPPPVPAATLGRRFLAGLVDQCFVLTGLLLAIAITSNAMSAAPGDLGARLLKDLGNPAFIRSTALEFGVIWLGYLALSVGLLEMTFGMWVWGLKIEFGPSGRALKKVTRVVLSLLFYPFIFPTLVLAIRRNGNTLIDGLTDSRVYRTTSD